MVKQVLVVEAGDPVRETLVRGLRAEGHGSITASDHFVASSLFQRFSPSRGKFPFDLVILTWMVPKADGLEICRLLRQQENFVPTLVLSGEGSDSDRTLALDAGADDCLCEPFSIQELIARCRILLRRHHSSFPPEPTILQFEDVSINLEEYRVHVRGHEVNLTPTEFRLLELFVRNPRRIWTIRQLFEELWGDNSTSGPKTVIVHVRALREKIELRPGRPQYLVTVGRQGYRFG